MSQPDTDKARVADRRSEETRSFVRQVRAARFYQGATHDSPMDGMFSFFPCLPAEQGSPFSRPHIELPTEYFNPNLPQGAKGCAIGIGPTAKPTVRELWHSVAEQVLDQGLRLGVGAKSPIH